LLTIFFKTIRIYNIRTRKLMTAFSKENLYSPTVKFAMIDCGLCLIQYDRVYCASFLPDDKNSSLQTEVQSTTQLINTLNLK